MLKAKRLRPGDTVALVSTSSGLIGEAFMKHKIDIGKRRLYEDYGLDLKLMPNACNGLEYLYKHPEARAEDLMEAFSDSSVHGILNAIGGDDSIRLLPYIDLSVIKNNPKIFTGFSDTTSIHFMLYKAGLISYYGASFLNNWSEYVEINPYTKNALEKTFFSPEEQLEIVPAKYFYDDEEEKIWWKPENANHKKNYLPDPSSYERIQGEAKGSVRGKLFGGCLDLFVSLMGTSLWPEKEEFKENLLFLETSESDMSGLDLKMILRNLMTQGIIDEICGILFAKPARRSRYTEYKEALLDVVGMEAGRPDLPILTNLNFGHAEPIGVIPYGIEAKLDLEEKRLFWMEKTCL